MQKVVQGMVAQLEPRSNGWVAIHIQVPGKQYPVKLSTKDQQLLGLAQSVYGQNVDALYNEEQSTTINPHNGQPYTNRYLEALAPMGSIPQPAPPPPQPVQQQAWPQAVPSTMTQPVQQPVQQQAWPQPQAQPQAQPQQQFGNLQPQLPPQPVQTAYVSDDERENRIMRQAATKVAAWFLPMLDEDDRNLGSLIRISEQLVKYYREGVSWQTNPVPMDGGQPQPGGGVAADAYGDPGHPPDYQPPEEDDVPF